MTVSGPPRVQVVDGGGVFQTANLDAFVKNVRLAEAGLSYAVVAIMGPQSSGNKKEHCMPIMEHLVERPFFYKYGSYGGTGKSTLMNNMFGTQFVEMDAFKGR